MKNKGRCLAMEALALVEVSCGQRCGLWVHKPGREERLLPCVSVGDTHARAEVVVL